MEKERCGQRQFQADLILTWSLQSEKLFFFSSIFVKTPGKESGWLVWLTPPPFYATHSGHWDTQFGWHAYTCGQEAGIVCDFQPIKTSQNGFLKERGNVISRRQLDMEFQAD